MAVPKLRFKADDGSQFSDWEEHKIKEFVTESNILGHTGKDVVPKENVFSGSENTQYYIRHSGQLMYGKLDFLNCAFGIVPPELDGYESTLDAPAFDMHDISDKFLLSYVTRKIFYKKNGDIANGSRKAKRIHPDVFGEMPIMVPSLPEQQKIAEFLSTIDTVIAKQKETVSAWEERKKGVMQKLFSQEVRFKADDGSEFPEWEEKKLSEMFKKVIEKNRLDLPPLTIVQGYGTIRRDESERRIAYDEKGLKNYKAVQKDDFIVHLRSFEGGLEIANQDGIVSPAYHVYRGNDEVHPSFYYPYFRSSSFIKGKLSICVTGVRDGKNIEMGSFDELLIPHPCLAEQRKIADCLSSFDEVIEKQKATLAAWEELKKGLLQQMFV